MAAIFNGRHFCVLRGFSSGSPLESYLFTVNYDHAYHFARIVLPRVDKAAINAIKTLLNEIREKREILEFLQNCVEPLRFRDKFIGTKMIPLHTNVQGNKRKPKSGH